MPRRAARRPPRKVVRDGAAEARPRWPTSRLPGRSGTLLASLLLLLAVGPWLDERLVAFALWELLFTLVMLSGIASLSGNRRQALVAALLGLPAIACLWLRQFVPAPSLTQAGLGLLTVFLLYTAATVLLSVFRSATVTLDTLSGAFCVYLLMGLAWGTFDSLLYLGAPAAFRLLDGWTPTHQSGIVIDVPFNILVYFSFTTLTTIGYGDVLPVAGASRTAAILEAVLGHFYLAILVARLVGLHIADTRASR